jgi:hypothetical protein
MHDRMMAGRRGRVEAGWLCLALALALVVSTGCYSHRQYSWPTVMVGPGWTTYNGQVIWKPNPRIPELAGDLFVAVNTNGNAMMQFSKTVPMITAELDLTRWQINVPSQKQTYSGGYPLPSRFAWLQIPAVLKGQALMAPWQNTGGLGSWEISNPGTGEYLRGYFNLP